VIPRGLLLWSGVAVAAAGGIAAALPRGEERLALRVEGEGEQVWWRSADAPARWDDRFTPLADAVTWRRGMDGVEWGEVRLGGGGEAHSLKLVAVRLAPQRLRLALQWELAESPGWTLDRAPADAALAVNAGMFVQTVPWGWVVLSGEERLPPGRGPLSSALVILRDGSVAWVDGDQVSEWRGRPGVEFAFQSYPSLLVGDGTVPSALREGPAVNLTHRDARLALGIDREGMLLLALTRFDAPLPAADRIPFGVTLPEMAAIMGALGARQAVSLDGGISAQLMILDSAGTRHRWPGLRRVPLALLAIPRN